MRLQVDFVKTLVWLLFLGLMVGVVLTFLPSTGWSWTQGFAGVVCEPAGFCGSEQLEEFEFVEDDFQVVSVAYLSECRSLGLEHCDSLRSDEGSRVTVLITGGVLASYGEVKYSDDAVGLRYLVLDSSDGGLGDSIYCFYERVDEVNVHERLGDYPSGTFMLVTAELWWMDDGGVFATVDSSGEPTCVIQVAGSDRF